MTTLDVMRLAGSPDARIARISASLLAYKQHVAAADAEADKLYAYAQSMCTHPESHRYDSVRAECGICGKGL